MVIWQVCGWLLFVALLLLLAFSYDPAFFKENGLAAADFFSSARFFFFGVTAVWLSVRKLGDRGYELGVFFLAASYLFFFSGANLQLLQMGGDNVCQVAYWNILFRPRLLGTLGSAFAKPGQIVLLGLLYELSLLAGGLVFPLAFSLIMAACVWSLVAVATELGGRRAGILAFVFSLWAFERDFLFAESTIFVVTAVFAGLRLYYYHPRWQAVGRVLLVLSLLFRIEAIAVLAAVGLRHLLRREWRQFALLTAGTLGSLLLFVGVILQVQGSFARLNSGAAVGYVGPVLADGGIDAALQNSKLAYIVHEIADDFSSAYYHRFLFLLVLVGIAGCFSFGWRRYLSVFPSFILVGANAYFLGGGINLPRYCSLIYAFACTLGAGALVRYGELAWRWNKVVGAAGVVVAIAILGVGFDFSRFTAYLDLDPYSGFYRSAEAILADEQLPAGTKIMTEDDLLSFLLVIDPDRYPAVTALQSFNVAGDEGRKAILARTDFIWFDLDNFPFYYLQHLPRPEWRSDPFRLLVQAILAGPGQERSLYGFRFIPVEISPSHLLLKVAR